MSEVSPILSLSFIAPAQAQKHVTHNDAIEALDVLVQLVVEGFGRTTPPDASLNGEVHALGTGATGAWRGHDGELAAFVGGGWRFFVPRDGWIATEAATGAIRVYQQGAWIGQSLGTLGKLGINAEADVTNRLAVSGDATLLTHEGGDHRVKVNKADSGSTASLLFQSDFGGRAEMGLAGEDAWSIKVSPDGQSWTTALRLDPQSGQATGAAVQSAPDDTTPGRLMRADYGFGPGNLLGPVRIENGAPSGAVIETGGDAKAGYVRFADGTQICTGTFFEAKLDVTNPRAGGYQGGIASVPFAIPFSAPPAVSINVDGSTHAIPKGANSSMTDLSPRFWSAESALVDVTGSYIAIGRWI